MSEFLKEKRKSTGRATSHSQKELLTPWVLKILVPLGAHNNWIKSNGFSDDHIAQRLGLVHGILSDDDIFDEEIEEFDPGEARRKLKNQYRALTRKKGVASLPVNLQENIDRLSELLGLSPVEERLLAFAVLLHADSFLNRAADQLGELNTLDAVHCLAVLLDDEEDVINDVLSPRSRLSQSGLLRMEREYKTSLDTLLVPPTREFIQSMLMPTEDVLWLLRDSITRVNPGHLSPDDFEHISLDVELHPKVTH